MSTCRWYRKSQLKRGPQDILSKIQGFASNKEALNRSPERQVKGQPSERAHPASAESKVGVGERSSQCVLTIRGR